METHEQTESEWEDRRDDLLVKLQEQGAKAQEAYDEQWRRAEAAESKVTELQGALRFAAEALDKVEPESAAQVRTSLPSTTP